MEPNNTKDMAVMPKPQRSRFAQYFADVWLGVTTVLEGMWVTFKHLFRPTITVQYPKEKVPLFPRSRTMLVNDARICAFCLACKRACPANLFTISGVRADPGEDLGMLPDGKPKKIHIVEFKIDMSKCIYCGLCVDVCDTKSLHWEQPQEPPVYDRRNLHIDFSDLTEEKKKELLAREEERKKAKAAAAAAKPAPEAGASPKPTPPANPS
jgi:NADH-quinone oxidoreductase subunit I